MNREHEEFVSPAVRVEAGVGLGRSEALRLEPFVECLVEAAWGLLQTIERFAEVKDLVGRNVASFRRRQVDCLFEITVEESRFDVDLVAFEIQVVDQREENSDGVLVRDRSIKLIKVDSFPLRVTFSDINLARVDPACSNHSHVGLAVHNFPDLVLVHLGEFRIHCRFPMFPFT
jgi:hypothetical protein